VSEGGGAGWGYALQVANIIVLAVVALAYAYKEMTPYRTIESVTKMITENMSSALSSSLDRVHRSLDTLTNRISDFRVGTEKALSAILTLLSRRPGAAR
jgi:hypothetical protein